MTRVHLQIIQFVNMCHTLINYIVVASLCVNIFGLVCMDEHVDYHIYMLHA